jgi:hypothetical protein
MSVTTKQVEFLARAIVNRLEDRGLAEFSDAEAGIGAVTRVLRANFMTADEIETAASWARRRAVAAQHDSEHEVRRIASARGFIL